jgi:hypothetical protein
MRRSCAAALAVVCGWLMAPAPARSQDLPVTECALSPASLPPAAEGAAYNASVLTTTSPALAGMRAGTLPPGLTLVDRYLRGTPAAPGTYTIGLNKYYNNGCGKAVPQKQGDPEVPAPHMSHETLELRVRDTHPPAITAFNVTPATLGSAGGTVTLTVQAADNAGVGRIMMTTTHPDGHSGSALVPMTAGTAAGGTWSITFALGGNTATSPASYAFTVSASDADGNTAKAGPRTVVLAARTNQPPSLQAVPRP